MAEPVIMPRQGLSVESCILSEWQKDVGDKVEEGDILFTYETDKSTFELEAELEGTLLEKFFEAGDEVQVFTNVCVIGEEGDSVNEFRPESEEEAEVEVTEEGEDEEETPAPETNIETTTDDSEEDIVKISPRAENLADDNNLDYRQAEPTGPHGRIIERDIERLLEEGPVYTHSAQAEAKQQGTASVSGTGLGGRVTTSDLEGVAEDVTEEPVAEPAYEEIELTNIRENIADSMYESLQSTAQLTLDTSFDATAILNYRKKIKANREDMELENITLNDIILYTVSRTLTDFENLNAHFLDDSMRLFKNVHLGMAVDTDRGLMVPNIFKANLKSLDQIAKEAKARVEECQEGTISPDFLQGGTFTVTNLGPLGIESFTPVLNPPQTGILGVNTIVDRVKEVDGEQVTYPAMKLSLTFDHRALDGAPAARFLKTLAHNLENFTLMMAK